MEKPILQTVYSPRLLDLYDLSDSIFVVIDVFRATSTIATAIFNGAAKVIPVSSVEDCIAWGKSELNAVTAGERDGKVIPGLQYGNSPAEYTREFISGKTLVLTTTNGTKMLHMAKNKNAATIITGSFPNLSSVVSFLRAQKRNVVLGCSAWKDLINMEDTLFAGAVASQLKNEFTIHDDSTTMAIHMYEQHRTNLLSFAQKATHWHRLEKYGLSADLEYCMTPDGADVLVIYSDGALWKDSLV